MSLKNTELNPSAGDLTQAVDRLHSDIRQILDEARRHVRQFYPTFAAEQIRYALHSNLIWRFRFSPLHGENYAVLVSSC